MCTFRGDSRTLSAVLARRNIAFLHVLRNNEKTLLCTFSLILCSTSVFLHVLQIMVHIIEIRGLDTFSSSSHRNIAFLHVLQIMKRLAYNTVCIHSGELPGHCQHS
jgi:hypothetical protein